MDPRDPTAGLGMGRGIPRAGVLRRESHGSRKLEKNSVGGRGEGGVTGGSGVAGGGREGRVVRRRAPMALFPTPKFNSAAAAQEEVSGVTVQSANRRRLR